MLDHSAGYSLVILGKLLLLLLCQSMTVVNVRQIHQHIIAIILMINIITIITVIISISFIISIIIIIIITIVIIIIVVIIKIVVVFFSFPRSERFSSSERQWPLSGDWARVPSYGTPNAPRCRDKMWVRKKRTLGVWRGRWC